MTFEYLAGAFFALIGLLAPVSGAPRRRWMLISLTAWGLAVAVMAAERSGRLEAWL